MFCYYCGREIGDDQIFCPFCGGNVKSADSIIAEEPTVEEKHKPEKSSEQKLAVNEQYEKEQRLLEKEEETERESIVKPKTILFIILGVIVAAGIGFAAIMLLGNNQEKEVDLKSLMYDDIVYGYDGYAEMETDFGIDEEKMEAYLGTIKDDQRRSAVKGVLLTVTYYPDKFEKLSNGDVVTITAEYDTEMAEDIELELINESFEYTVEGLEEGEDIAYDPDLCDEYPEDFLFPDSDERNLTDDDIYYTTEGGESAIQTAINEIYARHGMIFGDSFYKDYFKNRVWYTPIYKQKEFKESWFNNYEKNNIKKLTDYRAEIRAYEKDQNSKVECAVCGDKIKKKYAYTDGYDFYCEDCWYSDWGDDDGDYESDEQ